jgi:glycosyltransferase involved in cell wall biosynthesis
MRILIATDAWHPQVNGVVRTYERVAAEIEQLGHAVDFITPEGFRTLPLPTYPEIRLALILPRHVRRRAEMFAPDHIHIATEGPIGLATRRWCRLNRQPFTTSYHTRFPEYAAARLPVPLSWGYALERWFHRPAAGVMVATPSLAADLARHGIGNLMRWSRGVDTELFKPRRERMFGTQAPVFLYAGRVAVEKNLEAFLKLDLPGRKVVVGGGPQLETLRAAYPAALFTGPQFGEDLARCYASADVFVFPSKTDTYGIVILEALASGLPVAAYPVTGPIDIVVPGVTGVLHDDLHTAAMGALSLGREAPRAFALTHGWRRTAEQFLENAAAAHPGRSYAARPARDGALAK